MAPGFLTFPGHLTIFRCCSELMFRDIFSDHNISVMRIEGNRRCLFSSSELASLQINLCAHHIWSRVCSFLRNCIFKSESSESTFVLIISNRRVFFFLQNLFFCYSTFVPTRLKRISKFAFRGVLSLRYLFIRLFAIKIRIHHNFQYLDLFCVS